MSKISILACLASAVLVAACGGGGAASGGAASSGGASSDVAASVTSNAAPANSLPAFIDSGPGVFLFTGRKVLNMLYASVTVCTPGSRTQCEVIDHVQVDTGSVGLRILASALSGVAVLSASTMANGSPMRQCTQFADGYTWGSVVVSDVQLAGRTISSLPINLIGDPAAGEAPPSCASGPAKNTVTQFGANGVLGIGSFIHDCGIQCVTNAIAGMYYTCPSAGSGSLCRSVAVPLDHQLSNPVAALDSDNNGVTITIPPVAQAGAQVTAATVFFGVNTQADNAPGDARFFTLDGSGLLQTAYDGQSQRAVIDTGSNGYFFANKSIPTCTTHAAFYCPTVAGAPISLAQTAAIVGINGTNRTVGFTVDNFDAVFTGLQTALPGAAAPNSGLVGDSGGVFFWGLPFFYGRTVHLVLEGKTVAGVKGPAIAF